MKNDDRKIHPAAALFPLLEGEAFDKFVEDMRVNGQTEPIVYEGEKVILDGRNRLRACEKLGIAPRMEPLPEGQDPLAFIISKNLHRRHLSESQRAMIGAQLADMRQGERTDLEPSANRQKVSQADAAKLVNASPRSLARAVKVQKKGAPVLKEAVQHGDLSISAAATIADLAPEQQAKAVNAATIPTAYRGLVPELAQLAAQIKLSKAANDRLATLPVKEQKTLAAEAKSEHNGLKLGRIIQGKADELREQEKKAKAKQKEQKAETEKKAARLAQARQDLEQRIIDVIVRALVGAGFDRETQERVYNVAHDWDYGLAEAVREAFHLYEDDDAQAAE